MNGSAAQKEPLLVDMMASLSTFIASSTIATFVIAGKLPLSAYLFTHIGCAATAIIIALASGRPPRRQALLHALMASFIGPAGSAGTFLCTIFEFCFRPFAMPFSEWFESIFPDENSADHGAFVELLHASEDPQLTSLRISSFRDTMAVGTIEQKQSLLALIARRFTPAFAPALRQALNDPVPAVRVQAAAATASIESRFSEKTFALTQKTRQRTASLDDHHQLASHLVEFAESGIAETQRSEDARNTALKHLDTILSMKPTDLEALTGSARILLHNGNCIEALARIQKAISAGNMDASLASLQLQALMNLGKFDDIRAAAQSWKRLLNEPGLDAQRLRSANQLWSRSSAHV
ncbi:MAG: hypothetical protein ABL973_06540 [Micropepsaceae bacterium]